MAVLAYTIGFKALVWMNTDTFKLIKIYFEAPEDSAFILSKSHVNRCRHIWDIGVTVRQTDRQTAFLALYIEEIYLQFNCQKRENLVDFNSICIVPSYDAR